MSLNNNKKKFIYEVDPLFFYDANDDGYGDFEGFFQKIEYIKSLNVDIVMFPDLFNQEKQILKPYGASIYDKYGKLIEFKKIIQYFNDNQIDFVMEINFNDILESNMNQKLDDNFFLNSLIKNKFNESINNKDSFENKLNLLEKIINFWNKNGIINFALINFEKKINNKILFNSEFKNNLKKIYELIKSNNNDSNLFLKSHLFSKKEVNELMNDYIGTICDFFIDNSYAFICLDKQFPLDVQIDFKPKKLFKELKKVKIDPQNFSKYFISVASNQIGRVSSRWMNEDILHVESIKLLLLIMNFLPFSSLINYGDEIGTLRCEIESIDEYFNFDYTERKRFLESKKISEKKFNESQLKLSPINSQSIMIWNKKLNGGFSNSNNLIRKLPINWNVNNIKSQWINKNSILNFLKNLIVYFDNEDIKNLLNNPKKIKIKTFPFQKSIRYLIKNENLNLKILFNPYSYSISNSIFNNGNIILSNYLLNDLKKINKRKFIRPYEFLVYLNKKN